jgi:hypothetical protein
MILNLPLVSDCLQLLQTRRQQLVNQCLIQANRQCFSHDYHEGEEVLKLTYQPNKISPHAGGSYNGTITLRMDNNTVECISI